MKAVGRALLVTGLLIAAILAGGFAWAVMTDWRFLADRIEARASARLGIEVEIGHLDVRLLPRPRLLLKDVRGTAPDSGDRVLHIEDVTVVPRLAALWGGEPALDTLAVRGGTVVQIPPGGAEDADSDPGLAERVRNWPIGNLLVEDLTIDSGEPAQAVTIERLRLARAGGDRLALHEAVVDTAAGRLRATGSLDGSGETANGALQLAFDDIPVATFLHTPIALEQRLGRASGRLQIDIAEAPAGSRDAEILWPRLGGLSVSGDLRLVEPEFGTEIAVELGSETRDDGTQRSRATAEGRLAGAPLTLAYSGDALLDIRHSTRPYALDLDLTIDRTRIHADGTVLRPLQLAGFDVDMTVSGPDPRQLYTYLGLSLPSLPPYEIAGRLHYDGGGWRLADLRGEVGDSDIRGDLSLDLDGPRMRWQADLRSTLLDLDDLGGLIGGTPDDAPGETVSAEQRAEARREAAQDDTLADDPAAPRELRAVDADVSYRADRLLTGRAPLTDLSTQLKMRAGLLTFAPLRFGLAGGDIRLDLEIDANGPQLDATAEARIRRVRLSELLEDIEIARKSAGILGGQGKLWMRGNSFADLLASADGGVMLLMGGGQLDPLLVEAAGLDIAETLVVWLGDREPLPLDCTYADLQFRDGVVELATVLADTSDTLFEASGEVSLAQETLDVTVKPYPKDFSLLASPSPLHIRGTFKAPDLDVDTSGLIGRTLAAVALASAAPVTAALPLLAPASDKDTPYCDRLVDRLSTQPSTKESAP